MIYLLISVFMAFANTEPPADFLEGISLYQSGKYEAAATKFASLDADLRESPGNLFNWGLAAYKANQKGLAVALWRKALYIYPEYRSAEVALDLAAKEMPRLAFEYAKGSIDNFNYKYLINLSMDNLILLHFLLFSFTGFLLIRYFLKRRECLQDELPLPEIPKLALFFFVLFIICSAALVLRISLNREPRATVISSDISLKTDASQSASDLITIFEGMEFRVVKAERGWAFLKRPDGSSGWLEIKHLIQTSGDPQW
jgi:tetratricopeptide (TPR) repeat protein